MEDVSQRRCRIICWCCRLQVLDIGSPTEIQSIRVCWPTSATWSWRDHWLGLISSSHVERRIIRPIAVQGYCHDDRFAANRFLIISSNCVRYSSLGRTTHLRLPFPYFTTEGEEPTVGTAECIGWHTRHAAICDGGSRISINQSINQSIVLTCSRTTYHLASPDIKSTSSLAHPMSADYMMNRASRLRQADSAIDVRERTTRLCDHLI